MAYNQFYLNKFSSGGEQVSTSFHYNNYNTTLQKGQELSQHTHYLVITIAASV